MDGAGEAHRRAQTSERAPCPGMWEKMVLAGQGTLSPQGHRRGTRWGGENDKAGKWGGGSRCRGEVLLHLEALGSHWGFRAQGKAAPGLHGAPGNAETVSTPLFEADQAPNPAGEGS